MPRARDLAGAFGGCNEHKPEIHSATLPKDANIHAREYQLYLPSKEELQQKLVEWMGVDDLTTGTGSGKSLS